MLINFLNNLADEGQAGYFIIDNQGDWGRLTRLIHETMGSGLLFFYKAVADGIPFLYSSSNEVPLIEGDECEEPIVFFDTIERNWKLF